MPYKWATYSSIYTLEKLLPVGSMGVDTVAKLDSKEPPTQMSSHSSKTKM